MLQEKVDGRFADGKPRPHARTGEGRSACHPRRAKRGKGTHGAERVGGFPSPPMAAPSPAGNDTVLHAIHSRHHRPCPGDPDTVKREVTTSSRSRAASPGSITANGAERGVRSITLCGDVVAMDPGPCCAVRDDSGDGREQRYVLTLFLTIVPISAIPCARSAPDEGRAREASQCGSRHGPVHVPVRRCV